jgi:predicted membrane-bound spermidine synthase
MKLKYILEFAVFLCGAVVMVFELVGSRVIGPFLGTSLFVWTSLIGVILASLSLGYYLGGRQADKKVSLSRLARIIFLAAICIVITIGIKDVLLLFLQKNVGEIRIAAVIASIVLFMPASIYLGMVSPYAAKLKLSSLENTGRTIGNLYAISTAGSISHYFGGDFNCFIPKNQYQIKGEPLTVSCDGIDFFYFFRYTFN